ncbi:MAG TPA: LacI family transcriptional regulator [Firmicutes bacterium]|jgi:DNA-binding LacI/PurR family transcriptional regulator|nr:LacI family transcriptional regulator [Bacillota bacterium]
MATIYDVADSAGVSIKTVSRVINGIRVKESTRAKVLEAMSRLDYEPSMYARGMAGQRTWTIGVYRCSTDFFSQDLAFYTRILSGFEQQLAGSGYRLLLDSALWRKQKSGVSALAKQVDGILMFDAPNEEERADLLKLVDKVPVVTIGKRRIGEDATYSTGVDNQASIRLAVKHLHSIGHRRIGIIVEGERDEHYQDRLTGYHQALEELGITYVHQQIISAGPQQLAQLQRWLEADDRPTAVVVSEERTAIGLLQTARRLGIAVPGELALITYEDSYFSDMLDPPLTVLRRDDAASGREAADMLLSLIRGETVKPRVRLKPADLIIRKSC